MNQKFTTSFEPANLVLLILCCIPILFTDSTVLAQSRRDTINIDFGDPSRLTPGAWNNIIDPQAGAIPDLINYQNLNSGIAVAVTDPFNNARNTAGAAADDSLRIPVSAATDSFFGSKGAVIGGSEATGGVTFYNLNLPTPYSFAIFASRPSTDNREIQYTVTGKTSKVVVLNPSGVRSSFVRANNILPADDGTIHVSATFGNSNNNPDRLYYLGVIRITYLNDVRVGPKALSLTYPSGNEQWEAGKQVFIGWQSQNVVSIDIEYSIDNGATWVSIATSVPAIKKKYPWTVPATLSAQALVRIKDTNDGVITDVSKSAFTIREDNGQDYPIVVMGSSTAAGVGPLVLDSAWVWRYTTYLTQKNTDFKVVNLALPGLTTADILPSGNPAHNVTKALSFNPEAIIVSIPSNDAANGISASIQMNNYEVIAQQVSQANVPLWVSTPQPRNFNNDQIKIQIQLDMVAAIKNRFKERAIDFWTGIENGSNQLNIIYDSGDGVHLNASGHMILYRRVVATNIDEAIINRKTLSSRLKPRPTYKLYPNPTSGFIHITTPEQISIQKIFLFSIEGKLVLEKEFGYSSTCTLDVSGLGHGLYLVQVQTAKGSLFSRVVLQ